MATDSPPTKPVTLLDSDLSEMSKNETLKVESEGLQKAGPYLCCRRAWALSRGKTH